MHLLESFQKEIVSLVFALLTAGILYLFRARARLLWAVPHGFTFLLQNVPTQSAPNAGAQQLPANVAPNFNIYTGSIVIFNAGRIPATEVEVTFNWPPDNYNLWPVRPFDTHTSPDNRFTLKFANLAPREQFKIELISPTQLPNVLNVRCKECIGRQINMRPMIVYKKWLLKLLWSLVVLGAAAVFYVAIKLMSLATA